MAIAALGRFALRTPDIGILLEKAGALLASTLDLEFTEVLELQPDGSLRLVAGVGWNEGLLGTAAVSGGGDSLAGLTLANREPVIVRDLACDSRFHRPELLVEHGVASGMSVVIGNEDNPWGVLGAHSRRLREFTGNDVHTLQAVAHILAEAIHRSRAEMEVRDREHRLRLVTDAMPVLIAYCDKHLVYRYCNARYRDWFGLELDEVVGHPVKEVIGEEAFATIRPFVERVLGGERVVFEGHLPYRHGPPRDVRVEYLPHFDESGRTLGFYGMISDITEKVRADASQAWLAAIVEHSHDAIIGKKLDGTITSWNAAAERMYGYRADEVVGRSIDVLFPPDRKDERAAIMDAIQRGEAVVARETFRVRKDGTLLDVLVSISPIRGKDGTILGASAVAEDLTEIKRAERARLDIEERLRLAREASEIGIFDWNIRTGNLRWDERIREIWGISEDQPLDYDLFLRGIAPEDLPVVQEAVDRSLDPAGNGKYYAEYRVTSENERWVAATGQVNFENGEPQRMVGIVQDITERKKAEAEKQEWTERLKEQLDRTRQAEEELRQVNRELNEFTGVVTHDLRNPLASALFTTDLMEEVLESGNQDQMKTLVASMHEVLRHMDRMIKELHSQALVRRSDRVEQDVRLTDVLAEVRRNVAFLLEEQHGELAIDDELPVVRGNPVLLVQLFSNLVDNAVKYRSDKPPVIHIRSESGHSHHVVTVTDNGRGVAREDRERIFRSSERGCNVTATVGSGIGLAFCRRIMEMHGGSISVTDAPDGGAAFVVSFPAQ